MRIPAYLYISIYFPGGYVPPHAQWGGRVWALLEENASIALCDYRDCNRFLPDHGVRRSHRVIGVRIEYVLRSYQPIYLRPQMFDTDQILNVYVWNVVRTYILGLRRSWQSPSCCCLTAWTIWKNLYGSFLPNTQPLIPCKQVVTVLNYPWISLLKTIKTTMLVNRLLLKRIAVDITKVSIILEIRRCEQGKAIMWAWRM